MIISYCRRESSQVAGIGPTLLACVACCRYFAVLVVRCTRQSCANTRFCSMASSVAALAFFALGILVQVSYSIRTAYNMAFSEECNIDRICKI